MSFVFRTPWLYVMMVWICPLLLLPAFFAVAVEAGEAPVLPELIVKPFQGDLDEMVTRGVIRVLVSPNRTNYFIAGSREAGFEYELMKQYEGFLNKGRSNKQIHTSLVFVPVPFSQLIPALLAGKGDIVAAGLTVTPARARQAAFTKPYIRDVKEVLVTAKSVPVFGGVDELSGLQISVLRGSSYVEHLQRLNRQFEMRGLAPVKIRQMDENLQTEDLLELINAGIVQYTVADDHIAALWGEVLPDIRVQPDLSVNEGGEIAWMVRPDNPGLLQSLNRFVKDHRQGSMIGNMLFKRYYGTTRWVRNPVSEKERTRLQRLIPLFRKYAQKYGFDWVLVMALAYQESGLEQQKKNPSGALGIMQIKPATAAEPYVAIPHIDRVEPNIHAGIKYLAYLRDRYFSDPAITPETRAYLSLAAYNAGPGRLRRMRTQAKKMGLDPNRWFQNVELAALRMVGQETVRYIRNILKYSVAYHLFLDNQRQREAVKQALCQEGQTNARAETLCAGKE